jgi:hypothetical protein
MIVGYRDQGFTAVAIVSSMLILSLPQSAWAGLGSKYATRDPVTCASTKEPAKGAPTSQQAASYVRCHDEGEDSFHHMILEQNVKVEIGKGRPFQGGGLSDINMHDVDPSELVYPIRGSFLMYQCSNIAAGDPWQSIYAAGKNCSIYDEKSAVGACWKTTFGDWKCTMGDPKADITPESRQGVAGPK